MNRIDGPNADARVTAQEMLRTIAENAPEQLARGYDAHCTETLPEPVRRIVFSSNAWIFSRRARAELDAIAARCTAEVMEVLMDPAQCEKAGDVCVKDEDALRRLRELAADTTQPWKLRWTAVEALSYSGDAEQSIPMFEILLDDDMVRRVCLTALIKFGGAKEIRKLLSEGRLPAYSVSFQLLLYEVAKKRLGDCVPVLRELHKKAHGYPRLSLASTLVSCGCNEFASEIEGAMTSDFTSWCDLRSVLAALPHMDKSKRPEYIKFVRDVALSTSDRGDAIECLIGMGGISSSELIEMANSENDDSEAWIILWYLQDLRIEQRDIQDLLALADKSAGCGWFRNERLALKAVALGAGVPGVALLKDRALQGNVSKRFRTACVLWTAGYREFKTQVIKGITEREVDPEVNEMCAGALQHNARPEDMWNVLQLVERSDLRAVHLDIICAFLDLLRRGKDKE